MDYGILKKMNMKALTLEPGLVNNQKDKLLYAYAFLNTPELNEPECNFFKEAFTPENGTVYGKDLYAASYGSGNTIPKWEDFFKENEDRADQNFVCIANIGEDNSSQVRVLFFSSSTFSKLPKHFRGITLASVEGPAKRAELRELIEKVTELYKKYKVICGIE